MKIGVIVHKASDWDFKVFKLFRSYKQLIEYMEKTYYRWVIEFLDKKKENDSLALEYIAEIEEAFGVCDKHLEILIYNDYIE